MFDRIKMLFGKKKAEPAKAYAGHVQPKPLPAPRLAVVRAQERRRTMSEPGTYQPSPAIYAPAYPYTHELASGLSHAPTPEPYRSAGGGDFGGGGASASWGSASDCGSSSSDSSSSCSSSD